jgi:ribosomal protein S12 methylthiotransferase accessory factor
MADAARLEAFDFLLRSPATRLLHEMTSPVPDADDRQTLRALLDLLRRHHLDLYAVDLSTDEAIRSGVRVVRVIAPALQPLSFRYRARYLGHRRVYDAPIRMGYAARSETALNPWPQPFA